MNTLSKGLCALALCLSITPASAESATRTEVLQMLAMSASAKTLCGAKMSERATKLMVLWAMMNGVDITKESVQREAKSMTFQLLAVVAVDPSQKDRSCAALRNVEEEIEGIR